MRTIKRFLACTSGATAIEYGIIASLIAIVIVSSVTNIGKNTNKKFVAIGANLT